MTHRLIGLVVTLAIGLLEVMVAVATQATLAAKHATATIPAVSSAT
jgi:hypothetical protein